MIPPPIMTTRALVCIEIPSLPLGFRWWTLSRNRSPAQMCNSPRLVQKILGLMFEKSIPAAV
jgi:hypothetical protein